MKANSIASWLPLESEYVRQGIKLGLSLAIYYTIALWLNWDLTKYGALAIAMISLSTSGASLQKGLYRILGTTFGVFLGGIYIALFSHDRWLMMSVLAIHIGVCSFGYLLSKRQYAWYLCAFVAVVIFNNTYPSFENVFHYGVFRWLETVCGVVVYSTVDFILWNQTAGDRFVDNASQLVGGHVQSLRSVAESLDAPESEPQSFHQQTTITALEPILQNALIDSPTIRQNVSSWRRWLRIEESLREAISVYRIALREVSSVESRQQLQATQTLINDCIDRLERVREHLHLIKTQARGRLKQPEISPISIPALKLPKREACQDAKTLPLTAYLSRQAVGVGTLTNQLIDQTMELSASLFPSWQQATRHVSALQSSGELFGRWPSVKKCLPDDALQSVIFPPLAFISAFLIWILFNPMFGQSLPMMCVVFAILSMGAGVSPVKMALPMVISTPIVTLIYWQLLPTLTEMWQLGLVLFVYGFVAAYASKYFAGAKSALIVPFGMICGLSNTQQFAFEGPVVFVVGMALGMAVTTSLYAVLWPANVFQKLHQQVNATLSNCARAFALLDKSDETRSTNEQVFSAIRDSRLRAEEAFVRIEASHTVSESFDARRLSHQLDFMALCVQREVLLAERDRLTSEQGNTETPAFEDKAQQKIVQASAISSQQDDFRSRCFGLLSQILSRRDVCKGEPSKPTPNPPADLMRPLDSAMSQWKGFLIDLLESDGSTDEEPAISRFVSEYASMRILARSVATTQNVMGSLPWAKYSEPRF